MNFFKIDCGVVDYKVKLGKETVRYGTSTNDGFFGLIYNEVDYITRSIALQIIPTKYRAQFDVSYLSINTGDAWPHTDSGIKVSINTYLKPSGFRTVFHNKKHKNVRGRKIENQTNGNVFNYEDLIDIDEFVAEKNETWVLNVSEIHSVQNKNFQSGDTREMIVVQSNTMDFDSVYRMFKEYGKVTVS
jgi:hypothetical protein